MCVRRESTGLVSEGAQVMRRLNLIGLPVQLASDIVHISDLAYRNIDAVQENKILPPPSRTFNLMQGITGPHVAPDFSAIKISQIRVCAD